MRSALFCVALLSAAGCASSFEDRFHLIDTETSRGAVIDALGEPDRRGRFMFTHWIVGPPEVLQGLVPDSTEVEGLAWIRPASASPDSLTFEVFVGDDGRVLATTNHSIGTVF